MSLEIFQREATKMKINREGLLVQDRLNGQTLWPEHIDMWMLYSWNECGSIRQTLKKTERNPQHWTQVR